MPEICISQVEYSSHPDGPIIHVFGRDAQGVTHRVDVTDFKPYFYAPASQANRVPPALQVDKKEYRSIHNEPMMKIYTKKPTDVRDIREKFNHHEADVVFTTRFLVDTKIKSGLSYEQSPCSYLNLKPTELSLPARICILDIECSDERGWPDPAQDPICCITAYDSFDKKYSTFLFTRGNKKEASDSIRAKMNEGGFENGCFNIEFHNIFIYDTERKMLEAFASYIKKNDPDILTGWNFTGFDAPYIFGRMEALRISAETLARVHGRTNRVEIRGRQLFDLLAGYKRMHLGEKESYRLDAIAFAEVGKQKVRFPGKVSDLWKDDPVNLVFYNFTDVELCVAINEKDETIEFHREISRYVGCPLEKSINSMPIIDVYVLRKASGRYVLPSKAKHDKAEEFEGATVFTPPVGVKENVAVLDLKSLYPMAMMTVNASPETKDPNGELRAPNGVRFKKSPDGLVREIQSEILKERDATKAARNKFPFGSRDYKLLDMKQDVIKIIMNSYYGVSGNPTFRLYDRDVGAATTSIGRAILEHNRKLIVDRGYQVVLGDTDSCGVKIPKSIGREGTMAIAKDLEKLLNDSYPDFAKTVLNADVQYFSVKFEKLYERFFSGGKKKRYAGLLVWKEGKDVHDVDIVGFETERSDSPKVTHVAMKTLMGMVLEGKSYDEIRGAIGQIIRKYRAGEYALDEIGIPGGIGKGLEEYETQDAQVRGAVYSNANLGTNFGKGSKPKRLYIKVTPSNLPKTDVICFEYPDQVPAGFKVDTEVMLEKTLKNPISRILEPLGWNWFEFDPATPTLARWGM